MDAPYSLSILSEEGATWTVSLPAKLKAYQDELEALLGKVFADSCHRPENFHLAQQLSLNWLRSKCRQVGLTIEE